MDDKPLAGQAALITGGGGGIGRASASWLARDGAAVVIMGRTEATLLDAKRAIHSFAGDDATVEVVIGDALDETQVRHAFQRAAALTDRLGIAVSVVGGGTMKPLLMFEPQDVMDDLERNILSAFLVIRNATPLMADWGAAPSCASRPTQRRSRGRSSRCTTRPRRAWRGSYAARHSNLHPSGYA
jgi:NAD(P)-dependent dehydrogenase (short-subunit alcohol dehydrogenase family)